MRIEIEPGVFELFPGYVRHVVVASEADNSRVEPELAGMLAGAQEALRADESLIDLKAHPRLASWRDAFAKFGVNANQCPPSIFNLAKRVRGGKDLPYVNTLVAIFNVVSMKYLLPAGGDDLDKVKGGVRLGFASGGEVYVPLGSPDAAENPKPGEVILCDTGSGDVFCRAWCWKNGDRSRIEASTRRVAINVDAMPPITRGEGHAAADETAGLVRRFCGAKTEIYALDAASPFIEV